MFSMLKKELLTLLWIVVIGQTPASALAIPMAASVAHKDMQQLLDEAYNQGFVRVIVRLETAFVPEGNLADKPGVQDQRKAIANAQAAVLARLRGCAVKSVRRYQYTPTLAMEVDPCGLTRLMQAREVSHIVEDAVRWPL